MRDTFFKNAPFLLSPITIFVLDEVFLDAFCFNILRGIWIYKITFLIKKRSPTILEWLLNLEFRNVRESQKYIAC